MFTAANFLNEAAAGALPPVRFSKGITPALVAGRAHMLGYLGGIPGAMAAPAPGVAGAALTTYAGQLPFANAVGKETALMRLSARCTQPGMLMLCDRLWHNSGLSVTLTTAQAVNSVALPARDMDASVNGRGVQAAVEVTTVLGVGTPTYTLGYTNSANVAGMSGTNVVATAASAVVGTFHEIGMAAGDVGVRSIQTFTSSATMTSGAISLVLYRTLAELELPGGNVPAAIDIITGGAVRAWNDTVPFLVFIPSSSAAANISGSVVWTQA